MDSKINLEAPSVISISNSVTDSISSMSNSDTVVKVKSPGCTWWDTYVREHEDLSTSISLSELPIHLIAAHYTIIDLSSSNSDTVHCNISSSSSTTRKLSRRSSTEVNRIRVDIKRRKVESHNRYKMAFTKASERWSSSLASQRSKYESHKYRIKRASNLNSVKDKSAQEICDEVNS